MSFIEQEFKDRFKNQQSLKGVDSDQLWADINANLKDQPTASSTNRNRIAALILLLLLLVCSVYFIINNSKEAPSSQIDQLQAEKETPATPANEPTLTQQNDPVITTNSPAEQETETKENSSFENKTNNQTNPNNISPLSFNSSYDRLKQTADQPISIVKKTIDSEEINSIQTNNNSTTSSDTDNELTQIGPTLTNNTDFLNTLTSLIIFPSIDQLFEIDLKLIEEERSVQKKMNHSFEISLLTGVNTSYSFFESNNFNEPLEEELSSAYTNKPGHSTSLKASWIIGNKLRVSSGFEYSNVWTKFNTIQEKEEAGLVEDYLVYFEYNPLTGDTLNAVYDDLMLNGINKRTVVHHNNFKYFSIPLEIGIQGQNGKLVYGLNAGLSVNFFVRQKGKSLSENFEILEFDNSVDNITPFNQFFIAYQINPFADFRLSDKIGLRLSPVVSYQTFGNSNLYQLKQSSLFTSINTGVVFKIK